MNLKILKKWNAFVPNPTGRKRLSLKSESNKRFVSFLLAATLLFAGLTTGCNNREEGRRLADAGISASQEIAEYYDSLALDLIETMELEAFRDGFVGGGIFSDDAKAKLEETITAIKARSRMATKLGKTYRALKELTEYDAGTEVKNAATGLAESIQGLPILPASAVIPSALIGEVAKDLADWKQSKDIRRGAQLLLTTLNKIRELMVKELPAYKSIPEERNNKVEDVLKLMIQQKMVNAMPLIRKVPESLGLSLSGSPSGTTAERVEKGLIEIVKVRFTRMAFASAAAGDSTVALLDGLIDSHLGFGKERGSGLSNLLAAIERAQVYINEIQKLREQIEENREP